MKKEINKRTKKTIYIIISMLIIENVFVCINFKRTSNIHSSIFKAYVETGASTNNYQVYSGTGFPGAGYYLNTSRSSCTNGGSLSQAANYKINFTGSVDKCTLYFSVDTNLRAGSLIMTMSDSNGIDETIPAGESIERSFTIQNTGSSAAAVKMSFLNLKNTYNAATMLYSLSYSETEEGPYKYINIDNIPVSYYQSTKELANGITIPANTTYYYKFRVKRVILNTVNQSSDASATLSTRFKIETITLPNNSGKADQTLQKLRSLNYWIYLSNGTPDFRYSNDGTSNYMDGNNRLQEQTDNTKISNGLYAMEDDYGTSYYFRGSVNNNYVRFAGLYWRIVRINGDGTLRLIYDGTTAGAKSALDPVDWVFNDSDNGYDWLDNTIPMDNAYAGYMFGYEKVSSSRHEIYFTRSYEEAHMNKYSGAMKEFLDNWYTTNLSSQSSKIADAIFCNDRSIAAGVDSVPQMFDNMSSGYNKYSTVYSANNRINTTYRIDDPAFVNNPTLKCPQKNDAFTVSDTIKGNGRLTYPIGLMTADELDLAGTHGDFYTRKPSKQYLSMTAAGQIGGYVNLFYLNSYTDNNVEYNTVYHTSAVAMPFYSVVPVINLTQAAVQSMTGNGTINNPFQA